MESRFETRTTGSVHTRRSTMICSCASGRTSRRHLTSSPRDDPPTRSVPRGAKPSSEIRFPANMTSRVSSLNVSNLAGGRKSRSLRAKSPTRRDRHMQCRHRSSKVPPRRAERSGCEASQSRPDARWPWGIHDPGQALAGRPGIENPPSKESQFGKMKGALGRESDDCAPIRFRPERCKRAK
jgi:hypothetical protein